MGIVQILACAFTIISNAHAEIISANSMDDIQKIIENTEEKDLLVVFDVDMTITQPNHPATFYTSLITYKEVYKNIVDALTPEQKNLMSTLTLDQPQILVEKNTPSVIANLQEKYKVMGFTAALATPQVVCRRIKILKELGVYFNFTPTMWVSREPYDPKYKSLFTKSILFGNGESHGKGGVFCILLKHFKRIPSMVIMIDRSKKHLEDIQKALWEHKIDVRFLGMEYKGGFSRRVNITKEEFQDFWMSLASRAKDQSYSVTSK